MSVKVSADNLSRWAEKRGGIKGIRPSLGRWVRDKGERKLLRRAIDPEMRFSREDLKDYVIIAPIELGPAVEAWEDILKEMEEEKVI